ncbi:nose resistant to fluoxetine protein 6-like [Diadema antillarum]|uniref:nose resistant to fluoxetine protein 6-like n=1 Tax=Diadema antillarum TaxID=105358 RepID=UPI003A87D24C
MSVLMSCSGYAIPSRRTATDNAGNILRLTIVYNKPYCRVSPYLVGMMLGYLMQRIGKRKLALKSVVVAGGWVTAVILYMVLIYGLYDVYRGASTLSLAASVMYITFSRFIFALALAWIIFACHYGYGGVVNDFLSWRFWTPLSRLTYSTYLLHPVIQSVYGNGSATPIHWSIFNYIILSAAFISLGYVCALAMCLLVEFPFINLGKMLMTEVKGFRGNGKRKR